MSFQQTVGFRNTRGFLGQIIREVPSVVKIWRLDAQTAVPNTFGKAFTYVSDAAPADGNGLPEIKVAKVGGAGVFVGLLVNPSEFANSGSAAGTLAPNLDLPAFSRAELMTEGEAVIYFTGVGAYGDGVAYLDATGALVPVGTASSTTIAGAMLTNSIAAPGLTTISLVKVPSPVAVV